MQQILFFIVLIGLGASYLWNQAQGLANISQIRQDIREESSQQAPAVSKKPAVLVVKPKPQLAPAPEPKIISQIDKVKISGLITQTLSSPSLITLTTNLQKDEKINITGWEFKTKIGSIIISEKQDIIVKSGDIIYISSNPNPFLERDKNFRPDKCLGYLSSSRNFTIPLPQTCPRPQTDKLPSYLNYWCKEYINTLGSCQAPTYDGMAKYELFKDDNCLNYLNANLNYNGCFLNYQKDQDFSSREWHIYLDRREKEIFPWTNEFDTLYLRDKNGLLVDKYDFGQRLCCD